MDEYVHGWIKKLSIVVIIMMLMCNITLAANEKVDTGKTIDKTKETAKTISNVPKELEGKIKVKDTDSSKYKVEKINNHEIKISKSEVVGEHTKTEISVDTSYLYDLDKKADSDGYVGYMRKVDGQVVETKIIKISDISNGGISIVPTTFSETVINGFSGVTEYTKTINMANSTIDVPDVSTSSNTTIQIIVPSGVGTYSVFNDSNINTYPNKANLVFAYPLNGNANDISGNARTGTATNVKWNSTYAYFDGSASITRTLPSANMSAVSVVAKWYTPSSPSLSSVYGSAFDKMRLYSSPSGSLKRINTIGGAISDIYTTRKFNNTQHITVYTFNGSSGTLYDTASYKSAVSSSGTYVTSGSVMFGGYPSAVTYVGRVDYGAVYNTSISESAARIFTIGYNGSSVSLNTPTGTRYPLTGTTTSLTTSSSIQNVNILSNTNESKAVTVRMLFTSNTTTVSETSDFTSYYINTNLTCPNQITNGSFSYDIPTSVNGYIKYNDPVLVSNNPNATVVRNGYSVTVYTGYVPAGTEKYYNIIVSYIEGNTEFDNTFIDTYRTLSDDIDNAFVLSGVLFTVCVGITILALLAGILTGSIDYKVSVITIGILVVSEIVILVGIIIISALFEGLI